MKKLLLVGACLIALSACQAHNPSTGGAVIGGLTGGLLGNTIGKGDGRTAAIIGGAIVGTIVGAELAGGNRSHSQPQQRTRVTVGQCNHISNAGVRAACEQGVAERDRQRQQQAEDLAYQCGRYGRCDPNIHNNNRQYNRTNHDPSRILSGNSLRSYNCVRYGRC
jgi:hypothetical protein